MDVDGPFRQRAARRQCDVQQRQVMSTTSTLFRLCAHPARLLTLATRANPCRRPCQGLGLLVNNSAAHTRKSGCAAARKHDLDAGSSAHTTQSLRYACANQNNNKTQDATAGDHGDLRRDAHNLAKPPSKFAEIGIPVAKQFPGTVSEK